MTAAQQGEKRTAPALMEARFSAGRRLRPVVVEVVGRFVFGWWDVADS